MLFKFKQVVLQLTSRYVENSAFTPFYFSGF